MQFFQAKEAKNTYLLRLIYFLLYKSLVFVLKLNTKSLNLRSRTIWMEPHIVFCSPGTSLICSVWEFLFLCRLEFRLCRICFNTKMCVLKSLCVYPVKWIGWPFWVEVCGLYSLYLMVNFLFCFLVLMLCCFILEVILIYLNAETLIVSWLIRAKKPQAEHNRLFRQIITIFWLAI